MTNEEAKSCIGTIEMLQRLAYNIHGVMDVIDVDNCNKIIKLLEQEPCDDAISRHEVLSIIECHKNIDGNDAIVWIEKEIGELPSVTPQPKIGEWLEKEINSDNAIEEWQSARCSVCDRYHTTPYMYYFSHYDYCPHCGTRVEGRQKLDKGRSKRNR